MTATSSGTFATSGTFTIKTNGAGLSPCGFYTSSGCYYDLLAPTFERCVYLVDGDATQVQSCPDLSSQGSVGASRQGDCSGTLGSTFVYGGDARYPSTWWSATAAKLSKCEFAVGGIPIDNLYGPTFMLYKATVNECIVPTPGGCDEPGSVLKLRSEYVWVPVTGDLAEEGVVAGCRAYQSDDDPSQAVFVNESSGPLLSSTEPTIEWDISDGTQSSAQTVTIQVDEPSTVDATITAEIPGDIDTGGCSVDMEAPELTAELAFRNQDGDDIDPYVTLNEEFELVLELEASPGLGGLVVNFSGLNTMFDEASDLTVLEVPNTDQVEMEQDSSTSRTWRLRADAISEFSTQFSVQATDDAGDEQTAIELSDDGKVVSALAVNVTRAGGDDENPGDGNCDTGNTVMVDAEEVPECTLAAAIMESNATDTATSGDRVITFELPGTGVPTIDVFGGLPEIEGPVLIDGSSQQVGRVRITDAQDVFDGLTFIGQGVEARSLSVNGFTNHGVVLAGDGGHILTDNRFGIDSDGPSNGVAGVAVLSNGNTIGMPGKGNTFGFNGGEANGSPVRPGVGGAALADAFPTSGNLLFGPGGGGTVEGNSFIDGLAIRIGEEAANVNIQDNEITSDLGIVVVKTVAGVVTITDNLIEGSMFSAEDRMGVALAGTSNVIMSNNELDRHDIGVLAALQTKLMLNDNTIDASDIGVLALGGSGTAIFGNEIDAEMGVFSVAEGTDDSKFELSGNEFTGQAGFVGSGGSGDKIEDNTFGGAIAALLIASSDNTVSNNTVESDVGFWLLSPLTADYGGNTVSDNGFESDFAVIVMEERATVENNTIPNATVGIFVSPSSGSVLRGNEITDAGIGIALFDASNTTVDNNSITGSTIGLMAAGDAEDATASGVDTDAPTLWQQFIGDDPSVLNQWVGGSNTGVSFDPSVIYRIINLFSPNTYTSNTISGNGMGMLLASKISGTRIGTGDPAVGNTISGNRQGGVVLIESDDAPRGVSIRGNSIFGNGTNSDPSAGPFLDAKGGVPDIVFLDDTADLSVGFSLPLNDALDLDDGPNGLQNHPIITGVSDAGSVTGQLFSKANAPYTIDLYANDGGCNPTGYGGGQSMLGTVDVTTNASGQAPFTFDAALTAGQTVAAIATPKDLLEQSSSQFSYCLGAEDVATITIVSAAKGERRLQVSDNEDFEVGDFVIINPGGPNEDRGVVDSFGSIILDRPLAHDHEPGELVIVTDDSPPPASASDSIVPVVPARLLETRVGEDTEDGEYAGGGRVGPGETLELEVAGRGGVPDDASAAMLNVTVVSPSALGFVTVFPCGESVPLASNLNYGPGDVVPNAVLAKIGDDGKVCVYSLAETDLVIDVNGFVPDGAEMGTVVPARLLETRQGDGLTTDDGEQEGVGRVADDSVIELPVVGRGGVPSDATAVFLNVTAVLPSGPGFVTVYPCGAPVPTASNLNYFAGDVTPNAVLAKVGVGGKVCLYSLTATDLVVDVNGFVPAV